MKYLLITRLLMTVVCLFYVYHQTGVATTLALTLIALGLELHAHSITTLASQLRTLTK